MKKIAGMILAALMTMGAMTACEVPEDDGKNAAERAADDRKAAKADKGKGGAKAKTEKAGPELTPGQENAMASAESYLDISAYSREGLIDQLKFEEYSEADATFAVDALKVNWKEQAAASAESYLDMSSYSRQGLIDQLKFEGYTQEQAVYGVNQAGL